MNLPWTSTIVQVRCDPYGCPTDPSERYLANFIGDDTSYFAHDFPGDWAGPLIAPRVAPDAFLFEHLVLSEPPRYSVGLVWRDADQAVAR